MTIKEQILSLLEGGRGEYFSGQEIAERLKVSRAAVWKAVNALRQEGYSIDAVTNKGYCLSPDTDILSSQGIAKYLEEPAGFLSITVKDQADSTNTRLRAMAAEGAPEGTVLIASRQTAGRGRMGRQFYSPAGSGIYLSLLLRPRELSPEQSVRITTMAASAMCLAISQVCGLVPGIKWVNDIFVNGKKVCGILTEGAFSMESGLLEYAVLGVGIDLYPPEGGYPEPLQHIAGYLFDSPQKDMKNRLTAAFLNRFLDCLRGRIPNYGEIYRQHSLVLGKKITVLRGDWEIPAQVLDIDDQCRLLVSYEGGQQETLSYGEIRIRL